MCLSVEVFCDLQSTESVNKPYKMLDNSDTISLSLSLYLESQYCDNVTLWLTRIPVEWIWFAGNVVPVYSIDEYTHTQPAIMFRISSQKFNTQIINQGWGNRLASMRLQTLFNLPSQKRTERERDYINDCWLLSCNTTSDRGRLLLGWGRRWSYLLENDWHNNYIQIYNC